MFGVVTVDAFSVSESAAASPMVTFPFPEMFPVTVSDPLTCMELATAEPSDEEEVAVSVEAEIPELNDTKLVKITLPENCAVPETLKAPDAVRVPANVEVAPASFWVTWRAVSVWDVDRFPLNAPVLENVDAPVTLTVPAMTVFPLAAATVNLLVATEKFPAASRVPANAPFPVAAATVNLLVATATFPETLKTPLTVNPALNVDP